VCVCVCVCVSALVCVQQLYLSGRGIFLSTDYQDLFSHLEAGLKEIPLKLQGWPSLTEKVQECMSNHEDIYN
jgi:hypothetical protein